MKQTIIKAFENALEAAFEKGDLPACPDVAFVLERPKQESHGDLAANLAMQLARPLGMNPRVIAQKLLDNLGDINGLIAKTEIAGPGFINLTLSPTAWLAILPEILEKGNTFGKGSWGGGKKVMVEFVSANPTGPLHVGHGRGAVLGDVLARLLAFSGFQVGTEYYINDAGNQMATLGRSVLARAAEIKDPELPFPENHYRGEYIKDLAAEYLEVNGFDTAPDINDPEAVTRAAAWAGDRILNGIKDDLKAFQVNIETWYSENDLVEQGGVQKAFKELSDQGLLYEKDDALWFRAMEFGDEKDRVVRRSNGETTYFASDIAYHLDKFQRGFERLINVWGADHHGYTPRLKAAVEAMGKKPGDLEIVLVQLVNLLRAGEPVAMSTRAGEFVTLREVVDEVGSDSARYIFLTRRSDSPLDFDLELAKQKSMDNPVYYVQYAHTRVKSVLRKAKENGLEPKKPKEVELAKLKEKDEIALARKLNEYPEVVAAAAASLEPHRITYYLGELAGQFHSFYNARRIMVDDQELAQARMLLARAVGQVLAGGLALLGVSAPEVM